MEAGRMVEVEFRLGVQGQYCRVCEVRQWNWLERHRGGVEGGNTRVYLLSPLLYITTTSPKIDLPPTLIDSRTFIYADKRISFDRVFPSIIFIFLVLVNVVLWGCPPFNTLSREVDETENHQDGVQVELLLRTSSPSKRKWLSIFGVERYDPVEDKPNKTM